jgi:VanZ family protein
MPDKKPLSDWLSRYLPLFFWLVFISFASSNGFSAGNTSQIIGPLVRWFVPDVSPATLDTIHFFTRKAAHFTEYAILGFLAARAFSRSRHDFLRHHWLLFSACLIVVYSLLDEYHQSFVPTRTASIYDSFIDMAGGITALAISYFWRRSASLR